jgi:hypothetical protein
VTEAKECERMCSNPKQLCLDPGEIVFHHIGVLVGETIVGFIHTELNKQANPTKEHTHTQTYRHTTDTHIPSHPTSIAKVYSSTFALSSISYSIVQNIVVTGGGST